MFVTSNWNLSISLHASFEGRDKWPAGGLRSLKQVDLIWHLDICNSVASFRTLFSLLWLAVCCCSCRERLLDVKQEAILSWFLKNAPAGLLLLLLLYFLKVPVGRHALPRCIHPSNWSYFSEIILKVNKFRGSWALRKGKARKSFELLPARLCDLVQSPAVWKSSVFGSRPGRCKALVGICLPKMKSFVPHQPTKKQKILEQFNGSWPVSACQNESKTALTISSRANRWQT